MNNIPKYSYMFSQLCLCSAKWICFFCQVLQTRLLIQDVFGPVGRWVSGRLVGRWSVDLIKPRKNMLGVVISPVLFGWGLFCYSDFNFLYIYDKEETNLITRSSHSNLYLFLEIYKYYNFKQNKPTARACCNFIKYFFYL